MLKLKELKIERVYISEYLLHYKFYFLPKVIQNNSYENKTALFFGLYNDKDLSNIINYTGDKYLLLFGSDIEYIAKNNICEILKTINFNQIFVYNNKNTLEKFGLSSMYTNIPNYTETISKSKILKNKCTKKKNFYI